MGEINGTELQIEGAIEELKPEFLGTSYHPLTK